MQNPSLIGIAAGLLLIYGAIFFGDGWQTFFDPRAFAIVFGGTGAALLAAHSLDEIRGLPDALKTFLNFDPPPLSSYIDLFSDLSRTARRDGLLALDRQLDKIENPLVRLGIEMAVDGMEPDEVESFMKQRIKASTAPQRTLYSFFRNASTYSPAFGMIGTLIGLIQMLQNLDDPSTIGPAMAIAMITTFYGVMLANLVFLPISAKVKTQLQETITASTMIKTGILGIVQGDAPSMIEKRLILFLNEHSDESVQRGEAQNPLQRAA